MFPPKSTFKPEQEFEEKVIEIKRVSQKTKGGSKLSFTALCVVGDRQGKVGVGLGKAADVNSAIRKGMRLAQKHQITVSLKGTTIPHEIFIKKGAAKVLLKPAPPGSGIIAGGPVRAVMKAVGVIDVVSKILGSKNKANNVYATMEALKKLKVKSYAIK